ncbi:MAG TPA: transglutaminase-like domain-containing protein [Patescibacteria group bacterium]|nr:transglutaminase-like domain-containing protein [Patescibacteria group bacterium]
MFKKALLLLLIFLSILFILPRKMFAEGEFITDSEVEYYLNDDGTTRVTHNMTLENVYATLYAKSYTLKLENIEPLNIKAYQGNEILSVNETRQDNTVNLEVEFPDTLVGKGEKRNFSLVFNVTDFAVRTGEVWEISIPKLIMPESYRNYSVIISVPSKLGNEAYISPEPQTRQSVSGRNNLIFNKEMVSESGISAGFGEFQIFSFDLNYHLENPLNKTAETEIAVPPDTAFQKLYYTSFNDKPESIRVDEDGNWLALYKLKARERKDIKILGFVQIYAKERDFSKPSTEILSNNLISSEFWQKDDPEIIDLAKELKTPKNIYDYVVKTLSYDYKRVKPNEQRLGAIEALKNSSSAICMEYTDLFISIARAANIPARGIDGYAYTENPEIQPLSLVADVLHSWPEYWDSERGVWIQIDPTWGSTTGGIDYFSKLDLRHFTFVIHGKDPSKPYPPGSYKLGSNPQKDVFVSFAKLPEIKTSDVNISANIIKKIPLIGATIEVSIYNPGPVALYDVKPFVYFDKDKLTFDTIKSLPPFTTSKFSFKIPFTFLGTKTPEKIVIMVEAKRLEIPSYKSSVILTSLVSLFIILLLITIIIVFRFKRNSIKNIFSKIKNAVKFKKDSQIQE